MTANTDLARAKARKQKILLAAVGAVFLVLVIIQGPKLWKQLNPSEPEATSAPATTTDATAGTTTTGATTPASTTTGTAPVSLAGVRASVRPPASTGQLASFSLFEPKDPFEQQGETETSASESAPAPDETPASTAGDSAAPTATGGSSSAAPKVPPPTYATIQVNGKPQQLQVKGLFPAPDNIFELVSLKKKKAKIGVAGGSFAKGETVTLVLDQPVTLMNTVTGTRYVVKLVYTGDSPEEIAGFTASGDGSSASTSSPAATSGAPTATSGAPTATSGAPAQG